MFLQLGAEYRTREAIQEEVDGVVHNLQTERQLHDQPCCLRVGVVMHGTVAKLLVVVVDDFRDCVRSAQEEESHCNEHEHSTDLLLICASARRAVRRGHGHPSSRLDGPHQLVYVESGENEDEEAGQSERQRCPHHPEHDVSSDGVPLLALITYVVRVILVRNKRRLVDEEGVAVEEHREYDDCCDDVTLRSGC